MHCSNRVYTSPAPSQWLDVMFTSKRGVLPTAGQDCSVPYSARSWSTSERRIGRPFYLSRPNPIYAQKDIKITVYTLFFSLSFFPFVCFLVFCCVARSWQILQPATHFFLKARNFYLRCDVVGHLQALSYHSNESCGNYIHKIDKVWVAIER